MRFAHSTIVKILRKRSLSRKVGGSNPPQSESISRLRSCPIEALSSLRASSCPKISFTAFIITWLQSLARGRLRLRIAASKDVPWSLTAYFSFRPGYRLRLSWIKRAMKGPVQEFCTSMPSTSASRPHSGAL